MDALAVASESDLKKLESELVVRIQKAPDLAALEDVRVGALGKNGSVTALLKTLGQLPPDDRRRFGQAVNAVKEGVAAALEGRKSALQEQALARRLETEQADITLPVRLGPQADGRIHPLSQVWDEITAIFADLGFAVAEGPDIETDDYNFTKLNIPEEHPARQEHDTFYFKEKADGSRLVLRTHTSPVQIRTMLARETADPHHRAGPRLSLRQRPDPHADVPSDRGAGDRRGDPYGPPQMGVRGILQGVLRSR